MSVVVQADDAKVTVDNSILTSLMTGTANQYFALIKAKGVNEAPVGANSDISIRNNSTLTNTSTGTGTLPWMIFYEGSTKDSSVRSIDGTTTINVPPTCKETYPE